MIGSIRNLWRRSQTSMWRANIRVPILLYHRVTEVKNDPWILCVSPKNFSEHLEHLRKYYRPISLRMMLQMLKKNRLPRHAVVITFDDGYADNYLNARPILEKYDAPATFFVTSGSVKEECEFWWDELDRVLLQPGALPPVLTLNVGGCAYHRELKSATHYDESAYQRDANWRAWEENAPSARQALYQSLYQLLLPMEDSARRDILNQMREWAGVSRQARASHRPLSPDEVVALAKNKLIEIGCHTVTHSILSSLSIAEQQQEIIRSKTQLEEMTNCPVENFAYPFGKRNDYTEQTVRLVQEAGFHSACSNYVGTVQTNTGLFELPRIHISDWDGEEFARKLQEIVSVDV